MKSIEEKGGVLFPFHEWGPPKVHVAPSGKGIWNMSGGGVPGGSITFEVSWRSTEGKRPAKTSSKLPASHWVNAVSKPRVSVNLPTNAATPKDPEACLASSWTTAPSFNRIRRGRDRKSTRL